jgi:glycosyltransferase involved in cell wall biosynthesis
MDSERKKVLVITYYWPPSGGAGVQRWLRFTKHLRSFGYEPVIYTPENAQYVVYDENLLKEVPEGIKTLKLKIREPNSFLAKVLFWKKDKSAVLYNNQQQKGKKKSFMNRVLWFIRGNLFIPDARYLWIKPSYTFLEKELSAGNYAAIVSTGPPHSMHMIAKKLQATFNIPWLADFRDPWTSMDYLQEMHLTAYARKKHARLEKSVIESASQVVVVGRTMYNEFEANYGVKPVIIHNGYNDTFSGPVNVALDEKFTIAHIGSLVTNRNCDDLWEVLAGMIKKDKVFAEKLEIRLVGNNAPNVTASLEKYGLMHNTNLIAYVPYEKTQEYLNSAQVLLLPIDRIPNAEFVLTGKLFEYLKVKRPILLIGPTNGDAADIIQSCNAGYCCNFNDRESIEKTVRMLFSLYLEGKNTIASSSVEKYSGYELTRKLSEVLDRIITKK